MAIKQKDYIGKRKDKKKKKRDVGDTREHDNIFSIIKKKI